MDELASLGAILNGTKLPYAVIGAHAVNAWIAPRFTADIDVTVQASGIGVSALKDTLFANGYSLAKEHGADRQPGPDFLSFTPSNGTFMLEVQVAKTGFQDQVVARARKTEDGLRVATPEDLIVMKLIANRPRDRADLTELIGLADLDWDYIGHWADEWEVRDVLEELRQDRGS